LKKALAVVALFCISVNGDAYKCNKIFEQRKAELIRELEKIEEQQQALKVLQNATESMLLKKEEVLLKKEEDLDKRSQKVDKKNKNIMAILEENKKILEQIRTAVKSKVVKSFAQMGADQAASIFQAMAPEIAAGILFNMKPKKMGEILSKMSPASASGLTVLLNNGPPFKDVKKNVSDTKSDIVDKLKKRLDY
jgi:flagellar motility protein MotE (MotC chaperone)